MKNPNRISRSGHIGINLSEQETQTVQEYATHMHISISSFGRQAIFFYIQHLEKIGWVAPTKEKKNPQ